jgi:type VI protein secretion system component Hcp
VSYITERRARGLYWIGGNQPPTGRNNMKNDNATKPAPKELSAVELDKVVGGKATFHDFNFVHLVDKASPVLMQK